MPWKFQASSLALLEKAEAIVDDLQGQGYSLTLRQLYYQLVQSNTIENTLRSYKNLGALLSQARLAGLIDWDALTDRLRNVRGNAHWSGPADAVASMRDQYQIDKWSDQPRRVEVWVEKDALSNVVGTICSMVDVGHLVCRGYTSQSAMWEASQRYISYLEDGQGITVLHLGDHDPSGVDMTRDIEERMRMFLGHHIEKPDFKFKRIALSVAQVEHYKLPHNPAKMTDSRAGAYVKKHGKKSWELDALSPKVIHRLIESEVLKIRDEDLWDERVRRQQSDVRTLTKVTKNLLKRRAW